MVLIYADTKLFLETDLHSNSTNGDRMSQMRELIERCSSILISLDQYGSEGAASNEQSLVDGVFGDGDNSSYLDMSMRKPGTGGIEVTEDCDKSESERNEYVDVIDKSEKLNVADINRNVDDVDHDDEDNIYDNYIVENKVSGKKMRPVVDANDSHVSSQLPNGKRDCPFGGLPAAHLAIKKARKIGWLVLNHRRRPFLHLLNSYLSKRFYVGLLCDMLDDDTPDWWMLMYSGTNQMKPTICIELRRFELVRVIAKKQKRERCALNADVKFELHEKTPTNSNKKFVPIVYQFSTTTTDECDQWYSTLMLLNSESSHSICSGTNRKLPMLPPYERDSTNGPSDCHQQSDGLLYTNDGVHNYSEGVYEEPEEYYRQLDTPIATSSPIPYKLATTRPTNAADALFTYDVPKSPARPVQTVEKSSVFIEVTNRQSDALKATDSCTVDNADDYDKVIVDSAASRDTSGRTKINEIRIKLTSHFKEHSQKYLSDTSTSPITSITSRKPSIGARADRPAEHTKPQQISSVRKFVSNLARIKRSSALPRKSSKSPQSPKSMKRGKKPSSPKTPTDESLQRTTKRNKVHMIINQLEANGQLTLLSGGGYGGTGVGPSGYNGSNRNSVSIANK